MPTIEELGIARMKAAEMSKMSKEAISLYTQGRKDDAIQILKKMADNGSDEVLAVLQKWGINYTPQKPSSSSSSQVAKPASQHSGGTFTLNDIPAKYNVNMLFCGQVMIKVNMVAEKVMMKKMILFML